MLQQLGLGRVLYTLYHRPAGALAECARAGGPLEQWKTARGREAMVRAAGVLPPPPFGAAAAVELHVLTGRRFWYQTAFCLWTFARAAQHAVRPIIYDDGTLTSELADRLRRIFPNTRVVPRAEIIARLDQQLPAKRYPVLRERWLHYPNIRKLTDPHAGSSGWKLVIDSDLLFFRRPGFLLDWLQAPDRPLHAVDVETSYGYSLPLLNSVAGRELAERVNVGLTGLRSEEIDWDLLEHGCARLIEAAGTHYYLEQAVIAMLLAGRLCAVAPEADYVTLPRQPEVERCAAVMHHYVADSKRWYLRRNWRKAMEPRTA